MRFDFVPNEKAVTINGHDFKLKLGDVAMMEKLDGLRAMAGKLKGKDAADGVRRLCAIVGEQIDAMLGAGAYEAIFGDRALNSFEHLDLVTWLMAESEKFAAERRLLLLGSRNEPVTVNTEVVDARIGPDDPVQ